MSAMVNLEIPWINIMSKMDLVLPTNDDSGEPRNGMRKRRDIARYVETRSHSCLGGSLLQSRNSHAITDI